MLAIFTMDNLKGKESISGQQERSTKEISKKDLSMALVNGRKGWEMEQMFLKVSTSKTNVVDMALLHGG